MEAVVHHALMGRLPGRPTDRSNGATFAPISAPLLQVIALPSPGRVPLAETWATWYGAHVSALQAPSHREFGAPGLFPLRAMKTDGNGQENP